MFKKWIERKAQIRAGEILEEREKAIFTLEHFNYIARNQKRIERQITTLTFAVITYTILALVLIKRISTNGKA